MGGLAIATLAGDHIQRTTQVLDACHGLSQGVRTVTLVTWVSASGWIAPLIYAGVRRIRRPTRTAPFAWWAMVFPLGMYSAATHAVAGPTTWRWLATIALAFFWIAFTSWLIVTVTSIHTASKAFGHGSRTTARRHATPTTSKHGIDAGPTAHRNS